MQLITARATVRLDFESFLAGPVMSSPAGIFSDDVSPIEILLGYLPSDVLELEDEELHQALEEACLLVTQAKPGFREFTKEVEILSVEVRGDELHAIRNAIRQAFQVCRA